MQKASTRITSNRLFTLLAAPRVLVGGGVAFAVAMLSISGVILYGGRHDATQHSLEWSNNTLNVVSQDIAHDIELCDLALQAVVDGMDRADVRAAPEALRRTVLFDRAAMLPYLRAVFVADANGRVLIDSRTPRPPAASVKNADYFEVQRDHAAWGLFVSAPHASQLLDAEQVLYLSRRITGPDGAFLGVVVGAIDVRYLQGLLSGLNVGEHGSAALVHTDGEFVARVPGGESMVGRSVRGTHTLKLLMAERQGSFRAQASVDGIVRVYTFKHIAGLPLIVDVAPAETDIYAQWRERAVRVGVVMLLVCAAFVGVAQLFVRALGQKDRAEAALLKLAQTDGLTGLANRRTLDEILEREWHRAVRAKQPLSVLFVDLDHFKAYNDHYGHQAGDAVLIALGHCLAEHVRRPADRVARYGGEEFVAVLPDTDSIGALSLAEHLREAVAKLSIEHAGSAEGKVTVSIGAASWQGLRAESVSSVVQAADRALYRAKSIGRNRVFGTILG
jgi:diguanylate cyclase (GGDEF)-like protein